MLFFPFYNIMMSLHFPFILFSLSYAVVSSCFYVFKLPQPHHVYILM